MRGVCTSDVPVPCGKRSYIAVHLHIRIAGTPYVYLRKREVGTALQPLVRVGFHDLCVSLPELAAQGTLLPPGGLSASGQGEVRLILY